MVQLCISCAARRAAGSWEGRERGNFGFSIIGSYAFSVFLRFLLVLKSFGRLGVALGLASCVYAHV